MPTITPKNSEDERQLRYLATPLGESGSGQVRYAAAMYFNRRGMIDYELLEAYRICCRLDDDDPIEVARLRSAGPRARL